VAARGSIMENYLRVGVITTTHGIKGEVKVYPTTDDAKRFEELNKIYLDTGKEYVPLEIEGVRYFKNLVILKFKEINDINDIEKYKGKDLLIHRDDAIELQENEYFIFDLLDSEIFTEDGTKLGVLTEVLTSAANDVYVVKTMDNKEVLLPAIKDCILDVDTANKRITVHLMDGLL
jgi:16S rRNA processing protein RimM